MTHVCVDHITITEWNSEEDKQWNVNALHFDGNLPYLDNNYELGNE